jgi:GT2 family glycosyltransferase
MPGPVEGRGVAADGRAFYAPVNASGALYMTGNLIVRRDVLLELSGFDERFSEPCLEDRDLGARLLDAGIAIDFAPAARVRHPTLTQSARESVKTARRFRWVPLYAFKHPERYRAERSSKRPLSHIEIDYLIGLLAAAALPTAKGATSRGVLSLVAANGIRRGFTSGKIFASSPREVPARALVSLVFPIMKTAWWIDGCVRFRIFTW